MSERGRVALIFGVVGAAAVGGGYYFFKIYQPAQAKKAAQAEITAWETRWQSARDCLMGPKPASNKTSEALAMREMLPDPWKGDSCTALISKLTRGSAPDTGYPEIEAAWVDLDKAATKAATAFATHVSAPVLDKDPLPGALDNLDAARAKLRAAAGLPSAPGTGAALPAATVLALADGKEPLASLDLELSEEHMSGGVPSAHGFVMFGKTTTHAVQLDLVAGAAPHVAAVSDAAMRAIPDASWGAMAGSAAIEVGAFDGSGAMPGPTKLPLPDAQGLTIAAVGGSLADGVVVYGGTNLIAVAHAHAADVSGEAPERILAGMATPDGDGRIALAYTDTNREHHVRIVKPAALASTAPAAAGSAAGSGSAAKAGSGAKAAPPPTGPDEAATNLTKLLPEPPKGQKLLLGPTLAAPPCLAADRAWLILSGGQVFGAGGARPPAQMWPPGTPIGCASEGLVFRVGTGTPKYSVCDDTCREGQVPGAPDLSSVAVVGGKLVAIGLHGGVLGVWREAGGAPTFYGLPEPLRLVRVREWPLMALTNGKTIDVLAHGASGYYVIRVPAS
ncbi:MAG: hypothetical protein JO257_15795 [Deltaproteobacteria bacterium]|nr:hypothetical protein [Deltaproteobacteria bacterium]